ncbi:MAG TPA: zinc ABC transporter substrate-binding protein, partial [Nitrosopumilaceae archaeon]|nr:zinc ABC transporter substrate-binding protein [Nitrosopumilaceae archaeon]
VIADELGGRVLVLSSLEIVEDGSSYIKKMEQNLSNLKEALCN